MPLSNDIVRNKIGDMSYDILSWVLANLKASPIKFSLQLNETTDVANLNQLLAFVRYVKAVVTKLWPTGRIWPARKFYLASCRLPIVLLSLKFSVLDSKLWSAGQIRPTKTVYRSCGALFKKHIYSL